MRRSVGKIAVMAVASAAFGFTNVKQMPDSESALWEKLDNLGSQMPLTKEKFEASLGTSTFLLKRDAYITIWRGEPVLLTGDLGIVSSEIKLRSDGTFSGGSAGFDLAGKCITLQQIENHYGRLTLFDTPRGHSFMDETTYRSHQSWGNYYFSFRVIARDCLASITLDADTSPQRGD